MLYHPHSSVQLSYQRQMAPVQKAFKDPAELTEQDNRNSWGSDLGEESGAMACGLFSLVYY